MADVTIERVSAADWEKLRGDRPPFDRSIGVAAFTDEREAVGWVYLVAPVHLEGIYIEPTHRKGLLLAKLLGAAEAAAKAEGLTKLLAYATDDLMADYTARLGYQKLPWTVWSKTLGAKG